VHFAIVGFGPQLPVGEADVAARGLGAHFTFTGPLYGDELLAVLNTADICVSPDPKNAMNDISTMNKVMEYMTLEKPVVQFDLTEGGPRRARPRSMPGPTTRSISPRDRRAARRPEARARMGAIGRARVEQGLSWAHSAPRLLAAYERAFAKRGGRAPKPG
jgi:glycosyltransferase involved in cell wall biosynthesis